MIFVTEAPNDRAESKLLLYPVTLRTARDFVNQNHRHHKAPQGGKLAIGVKQQEQLIGIAIIGRPVARLLDDGLTAEVTRVCVLDGYPNACSMLYSAAWRATRAIGYVRLITYTLQSESGVSLKASGYMRVGETGGGSWSRPSRERTDKHPIEPKVLWEKSL